VRKIIYDVAVSLDGFIARPDGDVSDFPMEGPHVEAYVGRLASYSTVLMGRKTYEFGFQYGLELGARAYPHMEHFIISRTLSLPLEAAVNLVTDNIVSTVQSLKSSGEGDIYLCGGGSLAGLLAKADLIDMLRLKVAPILLGDGIRLMEGVDEPLKLKHRTSAVYENGVALHEYDFFQ
jgi:dihydrofolate reductase